MMGLSRREFLIGVMWSAAALRSGGLGATEAAPGQRQVLASFVDALLPADTTSPAASELGVADSIHESLSASRGGRLLLRNGVRWLNEQAGGDFTALAAERQVRIVAWMADAPRNQGPRVFYERIRTDAITAYYAQPAAWRGTALTHPPQPRGYADELLALERSDA